MGSLYNKNRVFGSSSTHSSPTCTRTHQIGALALIFTTFFLTRLLDQSFNSTTFQYKSQNDAVSQDFYKGWPQRGYGTHLSLKIYVYDENEIEGLRQLMYGRDAKISVDMCVKGQWGTQVKIHKLLLQSRFRTWKKEEADLFFVPTYVKCVRMSGGLTDKEINQTYVKVLSQMPYFRLSGGRDHIFVFPRNTAMMLISSLKTAPVQMQGDRTDKRDTSAFNTWKDLIIPGNVDDGMTTQGARFVEPLPLSKRKHLANFLGRAQGKIGRLQLINLSKQFPDKECVPVILSDQVELPFQNVVDYTQISIKWPSTRIGRELLEYLESIPDKEIEGMIARGREVRCLWVYSPDSEPCSAFSGILWELQRKVRQFHQSTETFWLHNGSVVNRNLMEFNKWKPPMPLP
uniref:Exostosin GT47 domain-containing protein n=1 Tax=Daucus carota subsp. sativus TaxID=79200 RepID=A0A166GF87_DAUCS